MAEIHNNALALQRKLSMVPRWTGFHITRPQNVADHSYHVASTCLWLLAMHIKGYDAVFRAEVLQMAIEHDQEETITGDFPSPNKPKKDVSGWAQPKVLLKLADYLESLAFIVEEQQRGNTCLDYVKERREYEFMELWPMFTYATHRKPIASDMLKIYYTLISGTNNPMHDPKKYEAFLS